MREPHLYTHLEDYIFNLYTNIGIFHPRQLNPEMIGKRLGICIDYLQIGSIYEGDTIILDSRLSDTEQWQDFGHELRHAIFDIGNQLNIPYLYKDYQEWKANNFALHACIPTFMLDNIKLPDTKPKAIYVLQKIFNVDYDFAKKRLDQYMSNHIRITIGGLKYD
ncbi:ImmA/IrrE family metallo-endopeptidase [Psychrobacillus sp. FSL K6-1415]|uniref:ImmA/IrrE family metallo-endopeptidase n=1 Tax=Psychrobacillus sp. FSL K6-1415 TaxID=2921544 RepID=UPI0030F509EC